MSAKTILPSTHTHCEGCGTMCHVDELYFCRLCGESTCSLISRKCCCSCSRAAIAEHDAIHGAGSYERYAGIEIAGITAEEFVRKAMSMARGDA
jgi:hypothetical protein